MEFCNFLKTCFDRIPRVLFLLAIPYNAADILDATSRVGLAIDAAIRSGF